MFFFCLNLQPPPPYETSAPPAPAAPAQTPPSRTTPTEPRNYGFYNNSQVNVEIVCSTNQTAKVTRSLILFQPSHLHCKKKKVQNSHDAYLQTTLSSG